MPKKSLRIANGLNYNKVYNFRFSNILQTTRLQKKKILLVPQNAK